MGAGGGPSILRRGGFCSSMLRERSACCIGERVGCRWCGCCGSGPLRTCCVASCSKRDLREDTDDREVSSMLSLLAIPMGERRGRGACDSA